MYLFLYMFDCNSTCPWSQTLMCVFGVCTATTCFLTTAMVGHCRCAEPISGPPALVYTYVWCGALLIVAKSIGNIQGKQKNICTWIYKYLATSKLPTHHHGEHSVSILDGKILPSISKNSFWHLQRVATFGHKALFIIL